MNRLKDQSVSEFFDRLWIIQHINTENVPVPHFNYEGEVFEQPYGDLFHSIQIWQYQDDSGYYVQVRKPLSWESPIWHLSTDEYQANKLTVKKAIWQYIQAKIEAVFKATQKEERERISQFTNKAIEFKDWLNDH